MNMKSEMTDATNFAFFSTEIFPSVLRLFSLLFHSHFYLGSSNLCGQQKTLIGSWLDIDLDI
ncbi:hypothetical protein ABTK24_19305, partial [Acinetobacter baumannii]